MYISFIVLWLSVLVSQAGEKPNFIIIFTDDQGYGDLSCFGSETIKTPHIDQMAKEGRIFSSFYVGNPLCSASRAALMTGSYPKRLGMVKPVFFPLDKVGLHPDEVTIADMLKTAGYTTACIGKWHLGHLKPFLPTSQGFDYYYGIPYSNDMTHENKNKIPYGKWDKSWNNPGEMVKQWYTPLMENEEIIELPVDQQTITRRYTDKAIEFITTNKEKPFFVYLPHSMPHVPLFVPEDVYDPNPANAYINTIEHIDAEVGRVIKTVKELGLSDNTYIIFTTDNGPWLRFKHHAGSAGVLRGGKGGPHEGGPRVPCVMWGPGRIPAGTKTDAIASTIDLFPTFAKLANVNAQTRGPIDGLDISALIHGADESPRKEMLYFQGARSIVGIRQGDWKLLLLGEQRKSVQLFNLKEDISETKNLANAEPERVAALRDRLKELDASITKEIRSLGTIEESTDAFVSLFNGKDLKGWRKVNGSGEFKVDDGSILGYGENIKGNTFLRTEKTYKDFEFRYEFKFDSLEGNSGLQFRSNQKNGDGRVFGYQCEASNTKHRVMSAGIYDEARRGWLVPEKNMKDPALKKVWDDFNKEGQSLFKWDGWNKYVIRCQGNHIQTWLNGKLRADFHDTDAEHDTREGFFALQVHSGKACNVRWRNIQVKEITSTAE